MTQEPLAAPVATRAGARRHEIGTRPRSVCAGLWMAKLSRLSG